MKKRTIAIIGGGNMGQAFALGLLQAEKEAFSLLIANPDTRKLAHLKKRSITVLSDNTEAVRKADIVILAVKPQVLLAVLVEIQGSIQRDTLIISIAAGVSLQKIGQALTGKYSIVRAMPNLCAKIGESMSVWTANDAVTGGQRKTVQKILQFVGMECELTDEELINVATAISGSGPAYVFYLAELLAKNAQELGIPKEVAERLAVQTLFGSSLMLKGSTSPSEPRASVTSKGGTTEAAFKKFKNLGLEHVFSQGIKAAVKRARELNS